MVIGKKDEFGNQFVKVARYNDEGERWTEVINLKHISSIEEHRIGQSYWNNRPGHRHGYEVFMSNKKAYIWINDSEFAEISKLLKF